ncbi:hypothetical protein BDK51DRAFT_38100 [Blyttiomyces helicus]|uniref:Uncharacterized protein n=1 Tax=Blyttiomyces helicus TaxID=388810 RepID=A0A4V1IQI3_9FUNG|nr:hypothetical protein BDK51DRAFT_38100 [Blyttiomyces helicus]|eukprot:RKO86657.1 hypothetical protein BDK51DRAFT_38100 [Blyttiomyces helicus]
MPSTAHVLLDVAERACTACLTSLDATSPASTPDVDAAILACRRWRAPPLPIFLRSRTWATPPDDVLRYVFQWLRALGTYHARAALYSCTLVCRAWALVGTEELWRVVNVVSLTKTEKPLSRLVATVTNKNRSRLRGQASVGPFVRALRIAAVPLPKTVFGFMFSTAAHHFPNLRCVQITETELSLHCLAALFDSGPKLAAFYFDGYMEETKDIFCKSDDVGKAIIEGVRRLVSLKFYTPDVERDADFVTTLHSRIAANSPNLKSLYCPYIDEYFSDPFTTTDIAAIAASCLELVAVELTRGGHNVTDAAVEALLTHCPAIKHLGLFDTESLDTELALCDLLSSRGSALAHLRIGGSDWRNMSADLPIVLSESVAKLQCLRLFGNQTLSSGSLIRLPALRFLEVSMVDAEIEDAVTPRVCVSRHESGCYTPFDMFAGCWDRLVGTLPP